MSDQPKCHPGTRVAILDHLIAWAAALAYTYPIIWLHGPAGAGKSAIQRTIAQLLHERGLLLASFFFFRTAAGRNTANNFIATIAYQFALAIPATRLHIEQAIKRNPLIFSLSLWDQAQAMIISPILAILNEPSFNTSHRPRILIIDGLDECNDPDKQCGILDVLCRVLRGLPVPFALIIASRPEHHIRGAFNLGDLNRSSSRLSLDDSYNSDLDIMKFLIDKFSDIRKLHPFRAYLPESWPTQEVILSKKQSRTRSALGRSIVGCTSYLWSRLYTGHKSPYLGSFNSQLIVSPDSNIRKNVQHKIDKLSVTEPAPI